MRNRLITIVTTCVLILTLFLAVPKKAEAQSGGYSESASLLVMCALYPPACPAFLAYAIAIWTIFEGTFINYPPGYTRVGEEHMVDTPVEDSEGNTEFEKTSANPVSTEDANGGMWGKNLTLEGAVYSTSTRTEDGDSTDLVQTVTAGMGHWSNTGQYPTIGDQMDGKIRFKYAPCWVWPPLGLPAALIPFVPCFPEADTQGDYDFVGNDNGPFSMTRDQQYGAIALPVNECQTVGGVKFCAEEKSDLVCLYIHAFLPPIEVGCHYLEPPDLDDFHCDLARELDDGNPNTPTDNSVCYPSYVADACQHGWKFGIPWLNSRVSGGNQNGYCTVEHPCYFDDKDPTTEDQVIAAHFAKSSWHVTAPVIDCITETLSAVFYDKRFDGESLLERFQGMLRRVILAFLTIYVIFFSFNIVVGGEIPKKSEIFMAIIKLALVFYFALGSGMHDYFPALLGISASLSGIIFGAAGHDVSGALPGVQGMCDFFQMYHNGRMADADWKESLALWSSVDCKLWNYLSNGADFPTLIVLLMISIFIPGIGLIVWLISMMFIILIFLVMIQVAHVFILSAIALTLIVFVSPVFIPLAMFKITNDFFKNWLKELISYSLYPVVLFAFVALMIATYDAVLYGTSSFHEENGCYWKEEGSVGMFNDAGGMNYVMPPAYGANTDGLEKTNICYLKGWINMIDCDPEAMACIHAQQLPRVGEITPIPFLSISFPFFIPGDWIGSMLRAIIKLTILSFMFYHFMKILTRMAAELTGSYKTNVGEMSVNAAEAAVDLAKKAAKKAIDAKTGGAASKAEKAAKTAKAAARGKPPGGGGGGAGPKIGAHRGGGEGDDAGGGEGDDAGGGEGDAAAGAGDDGGGDDSGGGGGGGWKKGIKPSGK